MLKLKEIIRTDEIKQILIDEFYSDKQNVMVLFGRLEDKKETLIDDRLNNLFEELMNIIDARIKAIPALSGEEFYSLLDQKKAFINSFNRKYYKEILASNYSFGELGEKIINDILN